MHFQHVMIHYECLVIRLSFVASHIAPRGPAYQPSGSLTPPAVIANDRRTLALCILIMRARRVVDRRRDLGRLPHRECKLGLGSDGDGLVVGRVRRLCARGQHDRAGRAARIGLDAPAGGNGRQEFLVVWIRVSPSFDRVEFLAQRLRLRG